LGAGELEGDRPACVARREHAEHQAWKPGAALGAEPTAEQPRDDANAVDRHAEALREPAAVREHRLAGGMDEQLIAIPARDDARRLEWMMVMRRRRGALRDLAGSRGSLGIAAPAVGDHVARRRR